MCPSNQILVPNSKIYQTHEKEGQIHRLVPSDLTYNWLIVYNGLLLKDLDQSRLVFPQYEVKFLLHSMLKALIVHLLLQFKLKNLQILL